MEGRKKVIQKKYYLDHLIESREFRFEKLVLRGIDNTPIIQFYGPDISETESSLFHRDISRGDDYFEILHNFVHEGLYGRNAAPVARFADGEYAFYANSMHCNGLYQQAESVETIKKVLPIHIEALRTLSRSGKLAPVIYPGNVKYKKKALFSFLSRSKRDDSALKFIEFLFRNGIKLTRDNYLPFFVVYAYLTSKRFSEIVDGKRICILNSECNMDSCQKWFAQFSSCPEIIFVRIPDSYVATRWESIKEDVLRSIPADIDLSLVGAGVGALLVCVDVAQRFAIPVIDAGHLLNMMNGRDDKSNGPRLYTLRKA